MYTCKYIYIHTLIRAYVHTYIHTYMHACKHTGMHTHTHTYIHTYIHASMHTCIHDIHTYIHTYTSYPAAKLVGSTQTQVVQRLTGCSRRPAGGMGFRVLRFKGFRSLGV